MTHSPGNVISDLFLQVLELHTFLDKEHRRHFTKNGKKKRKKVAKRSQNGSSNGIGRRDDQKTNQRTDKLRHLLEQATRVQVPRGGPFVCSLTPPVFWEQYRAEDAAGHFNHTGRKVVQLCLQLEAPVFRCFLRKGWGGADQR